MSIGLSALKLVPDTHL